MAESHDISALDMNVNNLCSSSLTITSMLSSDDEDLSSSNEGSSFCISPPELRSAKVNTTANVSTRSLSSIEAPSHTGSSSLALKSALNGRDLDSLHIPQLKTELGKRNLSKSGKKAVLRRRLKRSILQEPAIITKVSRQNSNPNQEDNPIRPDSYHNCSNLIQSSVNNLRQELQQQLQEISTEVSRLREEYNSHRSPSDLVSENRELREKVLLLERENQKVHEDNRALLTTIRLLNLEKEEGLQAKPIPKIVIDEENKPNLHKPPSISSRESSVLTEAKNEIPNAPRDKETKKIKKPSAQKEKEPHYPKRSKQKNESNSTKKDIFIVGDSMIKYLQGHKMSKTSKVKVWTFPGSTTADMKYHVKPLINKKPDEILLHVGTNSLRSSSSAQACAEEIAELASLVNNNSTKVAVSSIIQRSDDESLNRKAKEANTIIEQLCERNNWNYIEHSNIQPDEHLNRSGLHLNRSGTKQFATNFINFLKKT